MLTPAEIAAMQATQNTALPDVATITRRVYVSDGAGGQTDSTTVASAACRLAVASPAQSQMIAGQLNEKPAWRITFAQGTDVGSGDMITVGARSFEVVSLLAGASWETARVALCAER